MFVLFFILKNIVRVCWFGLDIEFGLELTITLGLDFRALFRVWVRFRAGVRARIYTGSDFVM